MGKIGKTWLYIDLESRRNKTWTIAFKTLACPMERGDTVEGGIHHGGRLGIWAWILSVCESKETCHESIWISSSMIERACSDWASVSKMHMWSLEMEKTEGKYKIIIINGKL